MIKLSPIKSVTFSLISIIGILVLIHPFSPSLSYWMSSGTLNVQIEIELEDTINISEALIKSDPTKNNLEEKRHRKNKYLQKYTTTEVSEAKSENSLSATQTHTTKVQKKNFGLTALDQQTLNKTTAILARIRKNCEAKRHHHKWDFITHYTQPRKLLAKKDYKILYASNPKTGSTSFKKFLFHLDGDYENKNYHSEPRDHYLTVESKAFFENEEQLQNYVKIGIIRNPIVRMISAFRNKQLEEKLFFTPEDSMTDLDQFVHFVRTRIGRYHEHDVHLKPQWEQLDICQFPYDIIVQFEDSKRYYDLIRKLTNTTHLSFPGSRVDIGKDEHDSLYYVDKYFGSLNDTEKDMVYRKYFMDFEILDYSLYSEPSFPYLRFNDKI